MDSEAIKNKLQKAGLSEKEAVIYAYLMNTGGAYPSSISDATKINRSTAYKILLQLSVKGLVNEVTKAKKIFYQIENPTNLLRFAKSNVRIAKQNLESAESILPNLEGLYKQGDSKPQVRYFQGIHEVLKIYEEQINCSSPYEMLAMTNTPLLFTVFDKKFFANYRKQKEKKKITTRGILPDTPENRTFSQVSYKKLGIEKKYRPVVKFAPQTFNVPEGEIVLFDNDKVSLVNFKNDSINGTVIKDKVIFDMVKTIFEMAWGNKDLKE